MKMTRAMAGSLVLGLPLALALFLSLAVAPPNASALITGSDGGSGATVGVSTSSTSPGTPGVGSSGGSGDGSGRGTTGPACTYTPFSLSGAAGYALAPGGPTPGQWYLVKCPGANGGTERVVWIPAATALPPVGVGAGVSPTTVASEAEASIALPPPTIDVNPTAFSVVSLPTWLAVGPSVWHSFQATATAGGVSATATATPQMVTWDMGDGAVVVCAGPGTIFNPAVAADRQSTTCSHTYLRSSDGQASGMGEPNEGAFAVTAVITWEVSWTVVGGPGGGQLPPLQTASRTLIRVEQVESIGSDS